MTNLNTLIKLPGAEASAPVVASRGDQAERLFATLTLAFAADPAYR